jgi:hypothetical protein
MEISLAIAPANKDLATCSKPKSNDKEANIKKTANRTGSQFNFANVSEKCSICNQNDVLRHKAQKNWKTDFPNSIVRGCDHPLNQCLLFKRFIFCLNF